MLHHWAWQQFGVAIIQMLGLEVNNYNSPTSCQIHWEWECDNVHLPHQGYVGGVDILYSYSLSSYIAATLTEAWSHMDATR